MHLCCDESGGTEGDLFCVSALRLDPREAERALKVFRRQPEWEGEVKGHALDAEQRLLLLELALKSPGAPAVVACDARAMPGGSAAGTLVPEASLRRELLTEACVLAMEDVPGASCAGVTADGGRYARRVLTEERAHVEAVLRERGLLPQANHPRLVAHAAGKQHPGLQVADVVVNTVHRILTAAEPGGAPADQAPGRSWSNTSRCGMSPCRRAGPGAWLSRPTDPCGARNRSARKAGRRPRGSGVPVGGDASSTLLPSMAGEEAAVQK